MKKLLVVIQKWRKMSKKLKLKTVRVFENLLILNKWRPSIIRLSPKVKFADNEILKIIEFSHTELSRLFDETYKYVTIFMKRTFVRSCVKQTEFSSHAQN